MNQRVERAPGAVEGEHYQHLAADNIWPVELNRQHGQAETSFKFDDQSELLNLIQLGNRRETDSLQFDDLIDHEFWFLDRQRIDELDDVEAQALRQQSAIYRLDMALVRHWIKLSNSFVSKVKHNDVGVAAWAQALAEQAGPDKYGYDDLFSADRLPGILAAIDEKRDFRTTSLLGDFQRHFASLPPIDIWLQGNRHQGGSPVAVRLVDFTIHLNGNGRTVEPVIEGVDGQRGLMPEGYYVQPGVCLRLPPAASDMTPSPDSAIIAA